MIRIDIHIYIIGTGGGRDRSVISFVDLSVKVTNNFWKISGIIDGFNEVLSQIDSGVEIMDDELMSAIQFRTTAKGDLPPYHYIFRNPDPLGT